MRNLKDNLVIFNDNINTLGNYLLKQIDNSDIKEKFQFSTNLLDFNNINFSLDYEYNHIKYSIFVCEWYEKENLESEYLAFASDIKSNKYKRYPKEFVFVTKKDLIDNVKEINKNFNLEREKIKIIFIEDVLNDLRLEDK